MSFYPTDPPGPTMLECSIFGPGVGECVVVHLGDGDWMVVDSCLSGAGGSVALEYLEAIRVGRSAIAMVVATHWHDDHVGGLADVVAAAPSALFACSGALRREEFFTVVASAGVLGRTTRHGSGVDEMSAILRQLKVSRRQAKWSFENEAILRKSRSVITSLSPSSETFARSLAGFAGFSPKLKANLRRVPAVQPNETSVVLHVQSGQAVALLGADLETGNDPARGWSAIVNSNARPPTRAGFYKAAHHGSQDADHEGIWSNLLEPKPVAALTPFTRSGLPGASDITRLKVVAGKLRQSSPLVTRAIKRRPAVDRTVSQWAKRRPVPQAGRLGQVRVRLDTNTGLVSSTELFGAAFAP
ncbi:MAG: MBL fold metallo-hydrolase [Myxococcales bacterium]|nr:MBL fold metallo-hydrolase [Myxococcales bacterium]